VGYEVARECDIDCALLAGRYTLIDFEGTERFLPLCVERGISVINGGVFNGGFLADPKLGGTFQYRPTADQGLVDRALRIKAVCESHGVPIKAAAVQFSMGHPAVATVTVGASTAEHAREVIAMFEHPIPDAMWRQLLDEGLLPSGTPVPSSGTGA
jgi:D-threo-aldose 1-dehydrogenase